jgi:poly(A)-specific ribonuclease
MGISSVIRLLINAKKPIIGHNCMYDLIFLFGQFVQKLPDTYELFSEQWTKLFPITFDNKVLAFNSGLFEKTTLGELFIKCSSKKYIKT